MSVLYLRQIPIALILTSLSSVSFASALSFTTEFGTSFGGEEVAENDNGGYGGDNYNTGGGAIIGLAAEYALSERLNARGVAGLRYQGGDGSNSGLIFEGSTVYQVSDEIFAGIGFHTDLMNKVETAEGRTIDFETATGPMALLEWSARLGN